MIDFLVCLPPDATISSRSLGDNPALSVVILYKIWAKSPLIFSTHANDPSDRRDEIIAGRDGT